MFIHKYPTQHKAMKKNYYMGLIMDFYERVVGGGIGGL
jgi:hypothetical protein